MLRKIRTTTAFICFTLITLLFLDFTGTIHLLIGWLAKIQFLPALLALNVSIVIALLVITLVFGRIYCSVICPLGIFQDIISWISGKFNKNRFSFSPVRSWLRYSVLVLFIIAFILGISSFVAIFEPYSAYGRIASNLVAPVYRWGNNIIAGIAERINSYMFYSVDICLNSIITLVVAALTFVVIGVLAWRNGRTYCNSICPVGTVLGFLSKFSFFKHAIYTDNCNGCGICARNCKASCIDPKEHRIDYSRCIMCFDCIDNCSQNTIKYTLRLNTKKQTTETESNSNISLDNSGISRRNFLSISALLTVASTLKAQNKKIDGGLAFIEDKKVPIRQTQLKPPGSLSTKNFEQHCTACQLCTTKCPNKVLRPSNSLQTLMQPEMTFESGYCRPECVLCSEVCPTGAIHTITMAEKSSVQIGHAVWIKKNCVVITDKVNCRNCISHCPTGAIHLVPIESNNPKSLKIPVISPERCIGCGACEHLCPSRPYSAIYVEGHERHRTI